MTLLTDAVLVYLWIGVTAYALFAGADFGAGIWDLLAGGADRGAPVRARIEHSIGPVWEANHVWLIFTLVVLWTAFPPAFAALFSTLYIPFTIAAIGIIFRGAAFAFRKEVERVAWKRVFGAAFALSSLLTPFAFGTIAGAVASGRVPAGVGSADVIGSWVNPASLFAGCLAVGVCAYLASVYILADARRAGEDELVEYFRRRALVLGGALGAAALLGGLVLQGDAPGLFTGLTGRGLPVLAAGALAGIVSLALLALRRLTLVRATAALAVVASVWAWGVAQYPHLLPPSLDVDQAVSGSAVLWALVIGLSAGAVLVLPALLLLFGLFQQSAEVAESTNPSSSR
jgi:cytochrome d ubiquinol oxidase subunit II